MDETFQRTQVDAWDPVSVSKLDMVEAMPRRGALKIGKNRQMGMR